MNTTNKNSNTDNILVMLKNIIWNKLIEQYQRANGVTKALIIIFIILCFFCGIRLGYLGEGLEKLSKRIIPVHIPIIDPVFSPPMSLSFNAIDSMGRAKKGRLGGVYQSGDQLILNLHSSSGYSFFYTIVGIDNKGFSNYRENVKINPVDGQNSLITLTLDDTLGYEVYYVIASKNKFEIEGSIKKEFDAIKQKLSKLSSNSKGADAQDYSISLNETKYSYAFIYIRHYASNTAN